MDTLNKKWEILRRRSYLFRYIPFIDFVLVAGSMALGNAKPDSDFDVIIGTRYGRIFTVRFLAVLLFGIFGWRAIHKKHHSAGDVKNKICFNHFVTSKSYRLAPPYNEYWKNLYKHLIPIYGGKQQIEKFVLDNAGWVGGFNSQPDYSRLNSGKSFIESTMEFLLNRGLGDFIEKMLKKLQVWKIEKGIKAGTLGYKPRIRHCDEELEFHPDTRRTYTAS